MITSKSKSKFDVIPLVCITLTLLNFVAMYFITNHVNSDLRAFSGINARGKTMMFVSALTVVILLVIGVNIARKQKLPLVVKIIGAVTAALLYFVVGFIVPYLWFPQHCAFNLCTYNVEYNLTTTRWLGIGDPQYFGTDDPATTTLIRMTIDAINKHESEQTRRVAYTMVPGDLTQWSGHDGRFFKNLIGSYETDFALDYESGRLQTPTLEVLGNHDYDVNSLYHNKSWLIDLFLAPRYPNKAAFNRRNRARAKVLGKEFVTDEHGNWALKSANELLTVGLHLFPETHKMPDDYIAAHPEWNETNKNNAIKFLKQTLANHTTNWTVLTHRANATGILFEHLSETQTQRCLAVIHGDIHSFEATVRYWNNIPFINLPSPVSKRRKELFMANNSAPVEFCEFSYDSNGLSCHRIQYLKGSRVLSERLC